jgi:hypothetical protein
LLDKAIFIRIPIEIHININEVPPYEINGRGIPVVGKRPIETATFTKAYSVIEIIIPKASN